MGVVYLFLVIASSGLAAVAVGKPNAMEPFFIWLFLRSQRVRP